jgi:hypothetical protein
MFTIKYRTYCLSHAQPQDGPACYDEHEMIEGPFELISKEADENGDVVVYAHKDAGTPGITFGPHLVDKEARAPRPTLWVMNAQGATVAKYDL